jgi:small-conductance mechanosensitive channel
MDAFWDYLAQNWRHWIVPLALLVATVFAGGVVRWLVGISLRRWLAPGQMLAEIRFIRTVNRSILVWALLLGVYLGLHASPLPGSTLDKADQTLLILWVISMTLAGGRLAGDLVQHLGGRIRGAQPVTTLTQKLARWSVYTIGLLIVLSLFGVSIAPLLTALGVGGLAVALGLRDTLANIFAGIHVSLAGQIRPGDYIKLDTGQEGYVSDIGWRCTTIRMLTNNLVIIPNEKIAQAIVTNYFLPHKPLLLAIPVNVGYGCDPDQVETLLTDLAKKGAADIPGLLAEPPPYVSLIPGFGENSLQLTLTCQVAQFADQFQVQHELRKRILLRFREANVPFPK